MKEGGIPARVALRVIEEGSYTDDELVIEYLGGVLASSRTPRGRDDRGNTFLAQVSRLSTYHLRAHYVFYSEFCRLMMSRNIDIHDGHKLSSEGMMFVPFPVFEAAMDFDEDENMFDILVNIFHTLKREALLEYWAAGEPPILQAHAHRKVPAPELVISPTISGIELYLWALGFGRLPHNDFLDPELKRPLLNSVEIQPGSLRVQELPPIGQDQ